jgi:anaerobic selenocysteine-containing dehydrogenase
MDIKSPITTHFGACPQDCPDTCSMLFSVQDGKLISVTGNPDHPMTRGGLCVKLKDFAEHHYNPDRILYPMRRVGPKGSGQFERITWDEALAEIKSRWTGIISDYGAEAIMSYNYLGHEGTLNGLTVGDAFFNKLGATVAEKTFCASGSSTGYLMTVGPTGGVDPLSFAHSKYIILWAINTMTTNLHHWPIIEEARANGAKVVVIDPVATRTARSADWHIRPKPGTDAALALGMMHVIISEGLVDEEWVASYTHGYEELKAHVLADYPVERCAGLTGVPADVIRQLAREYATTPGQVIRMGVALERSRNGGQAIRAVACLSGLVGAWRHPGGGLLEMPLWEFPLRLDHICRPDYIKPGTRVLNLTRIGEILNDETLSPPLKSLMVYNANPMSQAPEQNKIRQGLAREDLFVVCSELFITDTAKYADILLPACMQAEQEEVMFSWGHFFFTYNHKVIEAPGEAVPNTELFRRLARTMDYEGSDWYRTDEEMIRDFIDWDSPLMAGITLESLKANGYARLTIGDVATRTPHAEGKFPTPTGKLEFLTTQADAGNFVAPPWRSMYTEMQPGEPVDKLPTYHPPYESAEVNPELAAKYPLNIISPKSHGFLNSQYANESVQQLRQGEQTVLINTEDAEALGIVHGQMVRVSNDRGEFVGRAKVGDEVIKGMVSASLGYWPGLSLTGSAVNCISAGRNANLGMAPTYSDNRVKVEVAHLDNLLPGDQLREAIAS